MNFIEEQKIYRIEFQRLEKKVKEYKKRIEKNDLNLNIIWETNIDRINLDDLETTLDKNIQNRLKEDYSVIFLKLDEIIGLLSGDSDKVFPKNNLWVIRKPIKIAKLIEFIEFENKIIPPIITISETNNTCIIDGNHRIALCRFLNKEEIPFIIENTDFVKLKNILKK